MNDIEIVIPLIGYNTCEVSKQSTLEWLIIEYITSGLYTPNIYEYTDLELVHFREYTYDEIYDLVEQFTEYQTFEENEVDAPEVEEAMSMLKSCICELDSFLLSSVASTISESVQRDELMLCAVYPTYRNSAVLYFQSLEWT